MRDRQTEKQIEVERRNEFEVFRLITIIIWNSVSLLRHITLIFPGFYIVLNFNHCHSLEMGHCGIYEASHSHAFFPITTKMTNEKIKKYL